jgi:transcriptional regulator with XRE-family HTH domain
MRLIGDTRHALNEALSQEYAKRKLTKAAIARALRTNKSFVSKKFSGESNMTFATLADLAYVMERDIKISLPPQHAAVGTNGAPTLSERLRDLRWLCESSTDAEVIEEAADWIEQQMRELAETKAALATATESMNRLATELAAERKKNEGSFW